VHLDQVLGLAPGAIEDVVNVLGRASGELVATKRMSRPSVVASMRAQTRTRRALTQAPVLRGYAETKYQAESWAGARSIAGYFSRGCIL
jgi:hypothetical protein